jgi:hypothetical protein
MSKRRWPIFAGPPLILIVATLLIARPEPVAEAARPLAIHQISTCAAPEEVTGSFDARPGSWWKSTERLDAAGTLLGRRLSIGKGAIAAGSLDLPVESSVSGPVGGLIVVTADDGSRSTVRVVSVAAGCGVVIHETDAVVRAAILNRHDHAVLAHLVDRSTRVDLGTWRIAIAPAAASGARLVAPALGDLAPTVGTVWGTGLLLDAQGSHLAVQSCADLGCLTRVFDLGHSAAAPLVIRGVDEGPMLGFAGGMLVTWAACPGFPCSILAWGPGTRRSRLLLSAAGAAAMTADGRRVVALQADASGTRAIELDPGTGRLSRLRGLAAGLRPLANLATATVGLEVAANEVAIGIPGANPSALNPDAAALEVLP